MNGRVRLADRAMSACVPSERPAAVLHAWVGHLCTIESDALYYKAEGASPTERAEAARLAEMGDKAWERAKSLSVDSDRLWQVAMGRLRGAGPCALAARACP